MPEAPLTCAEKWLVKMLPYPCYRPAPPFYDFCQSIDHPAEGLNCDECFAKNDLWDAIE